MKIKLLTTLLFIFVITAACPVKNTYANTAGKSAVLVNNLAFKPKDTRAQTLQGFLEERDSPLAKHSKTFIEEADRNGLDWKLVAAISGNESQFGHLIPPNSYNGWGYGVYGNNVRTFSSWDEGIMTVSRAIRNDYLDKWGATNVYEIGDIYAEDHMWANKVIHYISLIESFEEESKNAYLPISI